jgi:hypothetical protein
MIARPATAKDMDDVELQRRVPALVSLVLGMAIAIAAKRS